MVTKKDIIYLLEEVADLMEFNGENQFKVRAFRNGANVIRQQGNEFEQLLLSKQLDTLKGIGKGLQSVIYEYVEKGFSSLYEELKNMIPSGVLEMMNIRGLGPKKVQHLYQTLGISNVDELEKACLDNKLESVKGFTKTTQEYILDEIRKLKQNKNFILIHTADKKAKSIIYTVTKIDSVKNIEKVGELRRGSEIVSSLEFLILCSSITDFKLDLSRFYPFDDKGDTLIISDSQSSVIIKFYITEKNKSFTNQLFILTGSEEFVKNFSSLDKEYKTEEEIFSANNHPYVIPEMREGEFFELNNNLKANSDIQLKDFKGLLHFHSTYSDGTSTLKEMLAAAKELGFEYCAICDHSKSAFYANGLNEDRLIKQNEELKNLAAEIEITAFQGIESDILSDGNLDYPDDFLPTFDFIVASVHSNFKMSKEEMTKRMIKAVENPHTDLLGHPTGRLLLSRDSYELDTKKIIDACVANNVAIEINANPYRLDLDWRLVYYAREKGCLLSINPDAHSVDEINYLKYGIKIARKAGVQKREVINCFDKKSFVKFLKRKVKRNL